MSRQAKSLSNFLRGCSLLIHPCWVSKVDDRIVLNRRQSLTRIALWVYSFVMIFRMVQVLGFDSVVDNVSRAGGPWVTDTSFMMRNNSSIYYVQLLSVLDSTLYVFATTDAEASETVLITESVFRSNAGQWSHGRARVAKSPPWSRVVGYSVVLKGNLVLYVVTCLPRCPLNLGTTKDRMRTLPRYGLSTPRLRFGSRLSASEVFLRPVIVLLSLCWTT